MAECNEHNSIFSSAWWCADLPNGWRGYEEAECATISRHPRLGVLQISAARKPEGLVTDLDLQDFAKEHIAAGKPLMRVEYKLFAGFSADYAKDRRFWREWWLRSGNVMIYATYNVERGKEDIERSDVSSVLSSLRPIATTGGPR